MDTGVHVVSRYSDFSALNNILPLNSLNEKSYSPFSVGLYTKEKEETFQIKIIHHLIIITKKTNYLAI